MSEISINHREVETQTRRLKSVLSNLTRESSQEYRQISSQLRTLDGATSASYSEALENNNEKVSEACSVLDRLLSFMAIASKQAEIADLAISRNFKLGRR